MTASSRPLQKQDLGQGSLSPFLQLSSRFCTETSLTSAEPVKHLETAPRDDDTLGQTDAAE
jgi:hypothetical protein